MLGTCPSTPIGGRRGCPPEVFRHHAAVKKVVAKARGRRPRPPAKSRRGSFAELVRDIQALHEECSTQASRAVNTALTLRNWAMGGYLHHYELNGRDRARYGQRLVEALAIALENKGVTACEPPRLYGYLAFFRAYPRIADVAPSHWHRLLPAPPDTDSTKIFRSASGESSQAGPAKILRSASGEFKTDDSGSIFRSASGESSEATSVQILRSASGEFAVSGRMLVEKLSYSHLELLAAIAEPLKRAFYEIECIRGSWPVRVLKRQITSLYFERSGLSRNKDKLAAMVRSGVAPAEPGLVIRDPYVFEFLGLKLRETMAESDLEAALLDHLQEFLLELGDGFCLEARQKSIVVGRTRGFVDLVFYHRVLRCHVLVELKLDEFTHENLGQLNTYVTWFRRHMMSAGDRPPVGLLLCTGRDHAVAEYAMAGMDNSLFVSEYKLGLPDTKLLTRFMAEKRRQLDG
jgi:predicted nuclease of restriction endonuclease-like (RecB) superfamily